MSAPRTYRPWVEKHKAPHGFGTWCPEMPAGRAEELLQRAIPDPDPNARGHKLYVVDGVWCFVAQATRLETAEYHGYPVPGSEVPERVLKALVEQGMITAETRRLLRRQGELPEACP